MAKPELSFGERLINYAKAVAILIGAFGAAFGASYLKGEPEAERASQDIKLAYEKLAAEFNKLQEEFGKEQRFVDGFLEGLHTGATMRKLLEPESAESKRKPERPKPERKPSVATVPAHGMVQRPFPPAPRPARMQKKRLPDSFEQLKKGE